MLITAGLLSALGNGRDVGAFVDFLAERTEHALPGTLLALVEDIDRRSAQPTDLGQVRLIECADPALATLITQDRALRTLCRPIGNRHLAVRPDQELRLRKALLKLGHVMPERPRRDRGPTDSAKVGVARALNRLGSPALMPLWKAVHENVPDGAASRTRDRPAPLSLAVNRSPHACRGAVVAQRPCSPRCRSYKDRLLLRVVQDQAATVRMELLRRFHDRTTPPAAAPPRRTVGELVDETARRRAERQQKEEAERAEEKARREHDRTLARERRLDTWHRTSKPPGHASTP